MYFKVYFCMSSDAFLDLLLRGFISVSDSSRQYQEGKPALSDDSYRVICSAFISDDRWRVGELDGFGFNLWEVGRAHTSVLLTPLG